METNLFVTHLGSRAGGVKGDELDAECSVEDACPPRYVRGGGKDARCRFRDGEAVLQDGAFD